LRKPFHLAQSNVSARRQMQKRGIALALKCAE
jgi:hypothetical protein